MPDNGHRADTTRKLTIQRHDANDLPELKTGLLDVFTEVYAERLDNLFFAPERFWQRVEGYGKQAGYTLVTGTLDTKLVSYTMGYTLPATSGWWKGFRGDVDPTLLEETCTRTFAINELMVRPAWRRHGFAKALSAELLRNRQEDRATLLVRSENAPAVTAYQSWGFHTIGHVQPFNDAPTYEAMVRDLASG